MNENSKTQNKVLRNVKFSSENFVERHKDERT